MPNNGKTVLVTGANRGLGAAIASVFHDAGWHVIGTARNADALSPETVDTSHALDLSDPASMGALGSGLVASR
ncbi:MAG: SDR family NAD(P)-dependent oxidoreductase [Pseudomonadota bacterium]